MLKSIIRKSALVALSLFFVTLFALPTGKVHALFENAKNEACAGASLNSQPTTDCSGSTGTVNNLLKDAINIFSLVIGIIAVIMIIVGGLKYITSQGDSNQLSSARNTILYAIVGLVIVALAQFIVKFVLSRVKPR